MIRSTSPDEAYEVSYGKRRHRFTAIVESDIPPSGELQLELPRAVPEDFEERYGKTDEPAVEPELLPYQVRPSALAPAVGNGTISLGIGRGPVAKSRHGAIYRVTGATEDREVVEALAGRLVLWLNSWLSEEAQRLPVYLTSDRLVRVVLTPAGKQEGFLTP